MSARRRWPRARWSRRRTTLVLLVTLGVAAQAAAASAYTAVAYTPVNLVMTERPATSPGEVRATLRLALRAGEARLLRAESTVDQGVPDKNAVGQKITCERPDGTIVKETWGGTNLIAARGPVRIVSRLLFVAPVAGTYLCRQRVYVNSHYLQAARARLRGGFVGDVYGTLTTQRLGVTRMTRGSVFFPAGNRTVRKTTAIFRYRPPAGARRVDARTDVFLTNCYGAGGAGCPRGSFPKSGSTTYAVQGVLVPSNPACPTVRTARMVRSFDYLVHHVSVPLDLRVTLPTGRDCGSWTTYTSLQWLGGLPFVIQLYPYSQASIIGS